MIRYIYLIIISLLISCNSKIEEDLSNWKLESTEIIKHFERDNKLFQVIYSNLDVAGINLNDTSIVSQRFVDSLLFEEIHYNIVSGDSTKWRHRINKYNSDRLLIEEIDSVDGELRHHGLHFYKNDKLERSEFLIIIPEYNEMMERVSIDTQKSIVYNYYDKEGKNHKDIAVNKNNFLADLTGNVQYDTTWTFHKFDQFKNKIQSLSVMNGDTIAINQTKYDKMNRETMIIDVSIDFGTTTIEFKYDKQGNKIIELVNSDDFRELIKTEYNNQKQPIIRKTYRQGTLANISYTQ